MSHLYENHHDGAYSNIYIYGKGINREGRHVNKFLIFNVNIYWYTIELNYFINKKKCAITNVIL